MKNFEPSGFRNRKPDLGGRPLGDVANYAPKKRFGGKSSFENKPSFGNKSSFTSNRSKKEVTLYDATCTTCGKSCEVPFRPDGKKPVLCRDCFAAKNESPTNMSVNHERFTANEMAGRKFQSPAITKSMAPSDYQLLVKQLSVVEDKVNQILMLIKASEKLVETLPIVGTKETLAVTDKTTPAKVRKPKKLTPAIKKAAAKKKITKKAAAAKKR